MYLEFPISLLILQKWPRTCRFSCLVGLVVAALAIVMSSFATNVWHLIATQGILYPSGACIKAEVQALGHGRQRSGDVSSQVAVDKPEVPGSRSCDHSRIASGRLLLPRYAIDPVSSISGL